MEKLKYDDITRKITACAMQVYSTLGNEFQEVIYQEAMVIEMDLQSIKFERGKEIPVFYRDVQIGNRRVDFFIESVILLELKAVVKIEDVHLAQALNNLEAYNMEIGLLINFGGKSLEYKRLYNKKYKIII